MKEINKNENIKQYRKKVFEWYLKAAKEGYSWAQYNLGYMYYNGQHVKQDYKKAFELFTKSAENGNKYAVALLESIKSDKKNEPQKKR